MKSRIKPALLLSALAFCVLLLRPLRASFVIAPAVTGMLLAAVAAGSAQTAGQERRSGKFCPLALLSAVFFAAVFLAVWLRTKRLISLQHFDLQASWPILAAACIGVLGSLPFLSELLLAVRDRFGPAAPDRSADRIGNAPEWDSAFKLSREERRLLFCVAFVSVSVCSLCSPLYPFNDWVDANCFFTVGKSMLHGIVPYRDLYEQKGPLLYALYALCYPVSHTGFLGAWILEILAAWAFLGLAYRCHLMLGGDRNPVFLFLTAAVVYTAPAFLKGGSAEELSLPLVMLSFWYGLRCLVLRRDFSIKEAFLIGLSSGAVLWIKYSMLGFYLGFILVPAVRMLREGRGLRLLKLLGFIVLGVCATSLPVLAYFWANHALPSLWEAYFYNNIFVYGDTSSPFRIFRGLASGFASMLTFNDTAVLLLLLALLTLWREGKRTLSLHVFLCFVFAFGLIYAGGINLKYYSEILCVFVPVGVTQLLKLCRRLRAGCGETDSADAPDPDAGTAASSGGGRKLRRLGRVLVPILFTLALFGTENSGMLFQRRADMPQFIFAETLREKPDATLFNYGALDIGLFTTADILPSTRYFCMLNLPSEEMVSEMERYMRDGVTDYIVSRELEVDSPCYTLLQTVFFTDNGTLYPYYLYARSDPGA